MSRPRDYYEVLGIQRGASADEIRKAYRKLARQLHPDMNKAPDAAKKFNEVQEAYDVLSDADKRKSYDRFGHAGVGAGMGGAGPGAANWGGGAGRSGRTVWSDVGGEGGGFDASDFASIFEQMFGGAGAGMGGRPGRGPAPGARPRTAPQPGRDLEHTITITFMTAALGGGEQLRFGNGGETTEINVKIPPGIESGAKLRIKGKGYPSANGGPPGDLLLTVEVGKHPWFSREGLDLLIDVPVNVAEAINGVTVTVPLLKDGSVDVKVPPGIVSGRKLRVRGKGIVDSKGRAGDFYVVVQIVAPAAGTLSPQARQAVGQLEAELINPRNAPPWVDE